MITIQTSVYDKNSIKQRIRNVINVFIHPLETITMKSYRKRIKDIETEAFFGPLYVSMPDSDSPTLNKQELPKVDTVYISEKEEKYCNNRYIDTFTIGNKTYFLHDKKDHYYAYSMLYDYFTVGEEKIPVYYKVIYANGQWHNIDDAKNEESYIKGFNRVTLTLDSAKARIYQKHKFVYDTISKVGESIYNFFHTIDSIILCLRFPFLYPRNRFSGLHYHNWKIIDYAKKIRNQCVFTPQVRFYKEPNDEYPLIYLSSFPKVQIEENLSQDAAKKTISYNLYFFNGNEKVYLYTSDHFSKIYHPIKINDVLYIYAVNFGWNRIDKWKYTTLFDDNTDSPYVDYFYKKIMKYHLFAYVKIVEFIHNWILAFIFCIPKNNELDAMPDGWMNAFGIEICKKIRKALIKDNMLFSYRIEQIKEKFGYLHWYDSFSSKKVSDIIREYENISAKTCIVCGKPAKYITSGYICPYCEEHIGNKENATVIKEQESEEV